MLFHVAVIPEDQSVTFYWVFCKEWYLEHHLAKKAQFVRYVEIDHVQKNVTRRTAHARCWAFGSTEDPVRKDSVIC